MLVCMCWIGPQRRVCKGRYPTRCRVGRRPSWVILGFLAQLCMWRLLKPWEFLKVGAKKWCFRDMREILRVIGVSTPPHTRFILFMILSLKKGASRTSWNAKRVKVLIGILWPASQSYFHLLFIFIKVDFYSLSFLCDVCNEVHEHMQW